MTIPFYCVLAAMILMMLSKVPVAFAQAKAGGYDNRHPREQQARLVGRGARALAAHHNTIEAFPIFAAGVIIAHLGGGDAKIASILALTFIASRILYIPLYLNNMDKVRSTVWGIGYFASLGLALLPIWA